MLALVIAVVVAAEPSYPANIELHYSECASGDTDWFFFEGGLVIGEDGWGEAKPWVAVGRWRREGKDIVVSILQERFGVGRGRITMVASVDIFEDYVAVTRLPTKGMSLGLDKTFKAEDFTRAEGDGCEYARKHTRTADPHAFLRLFEGEHPETYQRVLEPAELKGKSRDQLRAMRNEVFARYGYKFKDPDLAASFSKVTGYRARLSTVDDFLSDVERENVKRLSAAEAVARPLANPIDEVRALVAEYAAADERAVEYRADYIALPRSGAGGDCCADFAEFSCASHAAVLVKGWKLEDVSCQGDDCEARVQYHRVGSANASEVTFEPERDELVTYKVALANGRRRIQGPVVAHVGAAGLAECLRIGLNQLSPQWWEKASTAQRAYAETAKRKLAGLERR